MDIKSLVPIGIVLIFIGMIAVVIGSMSSVKASDKNTKVAIGGFIGFIPFGFANDRNMLYFVIGLSAFIFVLFIILARFIR